MTILWAKGLGPSVVVFCAMMWLLKDVPGDDTKTTAALKTWLGQDRFRRRYKRLLRRVLTRVDIALRSDTETELFGHHYRASWSHGLLNLTLVLALAYPILALLAQWALTGQGTIGGLVVVPEEPEVWRRVVAICGIATSYLLFYLSARIQG